MIDRRDAFDLDAAIRGHLARLHVRRWVHRQALDEIEDHLRQEIDERLADGMAPPDAFARAARRLGEGEALVDEFAKLCGHDQLAQLENLVSHYVDRRIVMRLLVGFAMSGLFIGLGVLLEGGRLSIFIQISAILIVGGGALGALLVGYPWSAIRNGLLLALTGRHAIRSAYLDAARVFRAMGDMAFLAGFLGVIIGVIHVLMNLDNLGQAGAGFATALVSALYGLLAKLFIGKALADSFAARAAPGGDIASPATGGETGDTGVMTA